MVACGSGGLADLTFPVRSRTNGVPVHRFRRFRPHYCPAVHAAMYAATPELMTGRLARLACGKR